MQQVVTDQMLPIVSKHTNKTKSGNNNKGELPIKPHSIFNN